MVFRLLQAKWPRYAHLISARFFARIALAFAVTYFLFVTFYNYFSTPPLSLEFLHLQQLQSKAKDPTVCEVPQTDPWDPSILKYYAKQEPLECPEVQKQITKFRNGKVWFDKSLATGLKCWITPIFKGESDSKHEYGTRIEVDVEKAVEYEVAAEFIEVNCDSTGLMARNIYKYHYHNLKAKTENIHGKKILDATPEHPSVVMIGLDSMSYGNFIRQMPRTYRVMQNMGFQDMKSHVKVADNTYNNWMAILTGKRGTATKEFTNELIDEWNIWFDDFPIIWKNFSDQGYATLFAEDRPDIATLNYFGKLFGFQKPPTDHYFRTYWLAAFWSIIALRSKPYCYDSAGKHEIQLAYLDRFVNEYAGKRQFVFWWDQDMSHDYLNAIGRTDHSFARFLEKNSEVMQDSIIAVFSDHGHRYDKIRETVVGRLEARLPFLSFRIPLSIKQKYPNIAKSLAVNSQRMTTQFDLYDTLMKVVEGTYMKKEPYQPGQRTFPLWHPVPLKRTCYEAKVPEDYCPCFTEMEIPPKEAEKPAEAFIKYLNGLFVKFDREEELRWDEERKSGREFKKYTCQRLQLDSISFASVRLPPSKVIDDPQTGNELPKDGIEIQYRIVIQADAPSRAQIEGILVKKMGSGQYLPSGEIERNNRYGNTSHCVTDRTLKKICHCVELPMRR
ncbi:unnamed protein product, partial [Mesorhabditis belari]|uniref:Uncharacterized protein n=1 Tax=Mesorhabditis belari TaxID=2138241 RepID=A0AAF3FD68_9BILA